MASDKFLAQEAGKELGIFIDDSPTPFHAVHSLQSILENHGFEHLVEGRSWHIKNGGSYMVTRNDSSLVAFVVGNSNIAETGFRIIGAHTDSPNLRLKPHPVYEKQGYIQLSIEPYGGLLPNSWLNRDLSIAGRVILKKDEKLRSELMKINHTLLSIPQLAIHLDRDVTEKGLILNKQTHLPPIIGLTNKNTSSTEIVRNLIFKNIGLEFDAKDEIVSWDLSLYDVQPSILGGFDDEFIYASRLDNLASCHAAVKALKDVSEPICTCVIVCYDNEEVGSLTSQGAQSPFLKDVLQRIVDSIHFSNSKDEYSRAIAHSFCISADMAHAVHPNYADRHELHHMPVMGGGPVIKSNANQRYASDGRSMAFFIELCERAGVAYQNFVTRSDLACGTTIGPITAGELGVCTVDVGNPMFSMHSIREQAGTKDHVDMIKVMKEFFSNEAASLRID